MENLIDSLYFVILILCFVFSIVASVLFYNRDKHKLIKLSKKFRNGWGLYKVKFKKVEDSFNLIPNKKEDCLYYCENLKYEERIEKVVGKKKTLDIKLNLDTKTDKNYTLNINVQDPNTQKTISKSINFVWTKSDVFLWIKTDKYFYNYNDEAKLWFVTTDILGNKVWNKDFKLDIFKINYKLWNSYNLDKDEKIIKTQNLKTLENWMLDFNYKFEDYWEYRFEITLNNWYKTSKTIYVSGWNILLPNLEENKVQIASDKETYNVWDKMNVSISSPIVWVKALVTVEKNNWILFSP